MQNKQICKNDENVQCIMIENGQISGYVNLQGALYQPILGVGIAIVHIFVKIKILSDRINKTNLGTRIGCTTKLPNINSIYG